MKIPVNTGGTTLRPSHNMATALKFAGRELRGGGNGFMVFLACIALGVAAIAGVNSVSRSMTDSITGQGRTILGGDVAFSVVHRQLGAIENRFLKAAGMVSVSAKLRSMARLDDNGDQVLVELKAVDGNYPLFGELVSDAGSISGNLLSVDQVLVDPLLLSRLSLQIGDRLLLGDVSLTIAGTIVAEPDRVSEGLGFGPRVLISLAALERTGLVRPGSLVSWRYKVKLAEAAAQRLQQFVREAEEEFPEAGWRIKTRQNAAPSLTANIERFSQFLTLVGLASLIVGGVGVANSVRAFMASKRSVIATLKCLGGSGRLIFAVYFAQIMALASIGTLVGLGIGAAMPLVASGLIGDLLPAATALRVYPSALALAALYGLLTAAIFSLWPLAQAREIPAAELFRQNSLGVEGRPRLTYLAILAAMVVALAAIAVMTSGNWWIASVFIGAMVFFLALLLVVSLVIRTVAAAMPTLPGAGLRMAVANIHRPGALTTSVVVSLGLGLSLLCALALIDGNFRRQISENIPKQAPSFFFVDIQNHELNAFMAILRDIEPGAKIETAPMLRGRLVRLKEIAAKDYPAPQQAKWVLRGDRGITYAAELPNGTELTAGRWWPADYDGAPLVSFSTEEAQELGLAVGDPLVVNVFGRNIEATIANLRKVEWSSLNINFVMMFSPNTFAGAPHAHLATMSRDNAAFSVETRLAMDGAVMANVTRAYPAVTVVRVRDAVEAVNNLISQLGAAVRAAASITLLASVLVLGGALAAGNRERVHDAVVMKVLGARRQELLRIFALEYLILGAVTAAFAILAGTLASWFVINQVMGLEFQFIAKAAATTIVLALAVTGLLGFIGTWRILGRKAGPYLREL